MKKVCEVCGREYDAEVFNHSRQKYCSPECARYAHVQQKRARRRMASYNRRVSPNRQITVFSGPQAVVEANALKRQARILNDVFKGEL